MRAMTDLEGQLAAAEAATMAGDHAGAATIFTEMAAAFPGQLSFAQLAARSWHLVGARHRARAALLPAVEALTTGATPWPSPADTFALAAALIDAGAPAEARSCLEVVLRTLPNNPAALGALAAAHRGVGDLDAAWTLVQRALALEKRNPTHLLTAAQIRHSQGDLDDALRWLKKAENERPHHGPTRLQRALTRLLGGPTRQGWADFEHRGLPPLPAGAARWRGEPLEGRDLLIQAEQGIGDLFHFVRFAAVVAKRGAGRVIVEAPRSAVRLLRASGYEAVGAGEAPPVPLAVPVMSLPLVLESEGDCLTDRVPYLRTGEPTAPRADGPPRIGLVLRGNPDYLSTRLRDATDRSVSEQLSAITSINWVWMQQGEPPPPALAHIGAPALDGDWLDTARLLESLDALVTVDTGLAHLAGAMGKRVFVLLPFTPDWRWGRQGSTTPWYPSACLLRQPTPRNWGAVIEALAAQLAAEFGVSA